MASAEFDENSEEKNRLFKLETFYRKTFNGSLSRAHENNSIISIQDMGAAGLTVEVVTQRRTGYRT